jgi:2-dehydro-3-deoxy-D-arabinonate dehydratase
MTDRSPTRFAVAADPDGAPDRLCVVDGDGAARIVPGVTDVSALIAAVPGAGSLNDAVDALGGPGERVTIDRRGAPARPAEVWAAGVTYERSRDARMRESAATADVYERLYDAERPELFLKATAPRIVGPDSPIGLRADSTWLVPEPELGIVLGTDGRILGYTLGNDLSSRDIEGENPLYLTQAKVFAASCSLGPVVVAAEGIDPYNLEIAVRVLRDGAAAWSDGTTTARLNTRLERLVTYLRRDNWLAPGTVLLTGTGIVPDDSFTLRPGDVVEISCEPIGTLRNPCATAATLPAPAGWTAAEPHRSGTP